MARLNSVGGTNCAKSWSMSAPMAFCTSLASRVSALIVRSCSTGIVELHRKAHEHRRHLIRAVVLGASVHRHRHRAHERRVGQVVVGEQVLAQRLRAGGEHDVVHGGAERRLDVAHVVERRLAERDGAVRRDRARTTAPSAR